MNQPPPPYQFGQPNQAPKKKKLTCLGCVGIFFGFAICSGITQTIGRAIRGEPLSQPVAVNVPNEVSPAAPQEDENANLADQIKIVDATVYWKTGAGNPNGPKLVWVKPHVKNESKTPVGVVWANITIETADGQTITNNQQEIIFLAEKNSRGRLAPGAIFKGDKDDVGDPYPPFGPNGEILQEQPVKVSVDVFGAYADPNTGSKGQKLE